MLCREVPGFFQGLASLKDFGVYLNLNSNAPVEFSSGPNEIPQIFKIKVKPFKNKKSKKAKQKTATKN